MYICLPITAVVSFDAYTVRDGGGAVADLALANAYLQLYKRVNNQNGYVIFIYNFIFLMKKKKKKKTRISCMEWNSKIVYIICRMWRFIFEW